MAGPEGLAKAFVEIRTSGGVMEGVGDFVVEAPNVLEVQNARFTERGTIAKRYGAQALSGSSRPTDTVDTNTIMDVDGALALLHPDGAYQLDEYAPGWRRTNHCSPRPSVAKTDPLIRGNDSLSKADIAVAGDLVCVVWKSGVSVYYAFVHRVTRAVVAGPRSIPSSLADNPRVIAFDEASGVVGSGAGRHFAIVGNDGTGIIWVAFYWTASNTYQFDAPISTLIGSTPGAWDICREANAARFTLVRDFNGVDTRFSSINTSGTIVANQDAAGIRARTAVYNPVLSTIVAIDRNGMIGRIPADYSAAGTVSTLYTPTSPLIISRATIVQKDALGKMLAALSGRGVVGAVGAGNTNELGTDIIEIATDYTSVRSGFVPTLALAARGAYLGSLGINDAALFLCENIAPSAVVNVRAPVMFAVRTQVNEAGVFEVALWGRALQDRIEKSNDFTGSPIAYGHIAHTPIVGGEIWTVASTRTDMRFVDPDGKTTGKNDIDLVRFGLAKQPAMRSVTAQSTRLVGGGCGVTVFDTLRYAENTPPHINYVALDGVDPDIASDPSQTSALFSGYAYGTTYAYHLQFVWRWIDVQGNVHRGPPSVGLTPDVSGVSGNGWFGTVNTTAGPRRVCFPWAAPNAINGDRGLKLQVEVYIGDPNNIGTKMYRLAIVEPKQHQTIASLCYVAFGWGGFYGGAHVVNVLPPNNVLEAQVKLYTLTELQAEPAPPSLDIVSTQKRVWILDAESRLDVWPSKPLVAGYAPEFNTALKISIPHEGGESVGMAAFGDEIIVFKERQIYAIYGEPGSASGTGSTVQKPRLLFSDVGCTERRSIVEGPFGVLFRSERGFYVLTPGRSVEYVGEPVQRSIDGMTVTSAVLVPSESEVRFTIDSSAGDFTTRRALVWNYRLNTWSVWTSFEAVHACMWRGEYVRAERASLLYKETRGSWAAIADFALKIVTGWIKFDGSLSGFKRLWRAIVLGRWWTGGVKISVDYDYVYDSVATAESQSWLATDLSATLEKSDVSVGATVVPARRLELAFKPARQRIESVRFTLEELPFGPDAIKGSQDDDPGRGFELVGMGFEVGIKRGSHRHRLPQGAKK